MAKKKSGTVGFVVLLVMLVMLILAIVGVCIDWTSGVLTETGYTLGDLRSAQDLWNLSDEIGGTFNAMQAFAVLTVILAAAATIIAGICKVLDWKLFKFILVIVAIICVLCGVLSIIFTYSFCDKVEIYNTAAGAWLTAVGGIIAGLAGVFAAVKK